MDITQQQQSEREQKIGRKTVLMQQRENLRINIDAILQAIKDSFGMRDVDFSYVEKIEFKKSKFLLGEATKKGTELAKITKEIDALNAALGESE